ncbi:metalloregulator ArsR/SmtB family transcription factor [Pseudoclavibacter alba]|uniref:Metalloregulator ArsR/SmtB family transcription factor n=1 Tax=Pseudoclavibacter albus TaxID=272241 RepID=A0ABT2HXW7_9MICO|nr:metalloregulator ArsR/SmtB family transcription factor [Pseudoclavibacter alba]MCT2043166.1 metalloregulator ArsR/SmtB family transcription factor [Pseudoclavibacter alba]
MTDRQELARAAELFRTLGSESRLELLVLLAAEALSVSKLVELSGMNQPLVSQHLRTLREVGLVSVEAQGRERVYRLQDQHVAHVVADALTHAGEACPDEGVSP